jgi:hypothetical protein
MYVNREKTEAIVFAFSTNSDHWNTLVPRLFLKGLNPHVEYELSEPFPNNITQSAGSYMLIESESKLPLKSSVSFVFLIPLFYVYRPSFCGLVPVYQLGVDKVILTGNILMSAGLPSKIIDFYPFCLVMPPIASFLYFLFVS